VEGAHLQQLADAIDDAFARWDRSHLQEFILADGRRLYDPDPDWEIEGELSEDYRRVKLSRLHPGEQFAYVSDLGDDWAHLCTAGARRIDPAEVLGIPPETPLPYRGWGDIPDQYRHCWDGSVRGGSRPAGLWRPPLHHAAHPGDLIVVIDADPGVGVVWGAEGAQEC
jgi:Plasmid pRiA4b ORF-3-like protein